MDYTSTLETLEDLWLTLSWYSEHEVGGWAIIYLLPKVSSPGKLLMVVNKVPCSPSVNYYACRIDG